MAAQLDILALEPFYGGARRAMLKVIRRCSRHRWTLLKLPPRRIERRFAAAANWFAEQLVRNFTGDIDLVFTSEAMNLASLVRLVPELASRPLVVYFHDNHLPRPGSAQGGPFELVNLHTAATATEIWFNSNYHLHTFNVRAAELVARHPELQSHNALRSIASKARLVLPPMDLNFVTEVRAYREPSRREDTIFVETRDADMNLLNDTLEIVGRSHQFRLVTVGPVRGLSDRWERSTIRESDEIGQVVGMLGAGVFLSAKVEATSDYLLARAMLAGCRPVVPRNGVYPELLGDVADPVQGTGADAAALATNLVAALRGEPAASVDWRRSLRGFDAIPACRRMDQRLDELAANSVAAA